jgi:hypothetical protein
MSLSHAPRVSKRAWPQRGAALIIFLVIFVLGAIGLFVGSTLPTVVEAQRQQRTLDMLRHAKEALIGYAATYRDSNANQVFGYLPCPDVDGDGSPDTANCGAAGETVIGLLPFKTLGLEDLRDASGACLWYAVSGRYKASFIPDKPVPMNWDTQGQLAINDAQGQALVAPEDASGGAAAVIIAVGPPVAGQGRAVANTTCSVTGAAAAWQAYVESGAFPGASGATVTLTAGSAASTTNNDLLAWITPREIFDRVRVRSDFATQLDSLSSYLLSRLVTTTPDPVDLTIVGNKKTGKFPVTLSVPLTPNYEPYRDNWRDMYRYVLCSPLSQCLTVNGTACTGALLFAGTRSAGGPRTAAEQASATSLFEEPNRTAFTTAGSNAFTGATAFAASASTQDLVYCIPGLPPQPPLAAAEIVAQGQQADPSGTVSVDTAANTVTLGTAAGGVASGCFWYGTPIPFGVGLRIYLSFEIQVNSGGSGFTLALADANTARNPSTAMCGNAGQDLGYGGLPDGMLARIKPPKLGVEFDLFSSSQRNDPAATHVAIDYWGTTSNIDDDVAHGVGGNPAVGSSAVSNFALNTGVRYHARIDIERNYNDALDQGQYTIKAYVVASTADCTLDANGFRKLSEDLVTTCPAQAATVSHVRMLSDPSDGQGEGMKFVYLGLTQGMVDAQVIKFYDMSVQGR